MSQTPVHLRPKAKRTFHWEDTKAPAKPAGRRKRERTHEHRTHPHLRQIALALAFCLLTGCYAMMPPESAATSVLAAKKELPVYSVERDDHVIAVTFDASWGADNTPKLLDILEGDEAGLKSVTFEVSGDHAYGYLRGEKGVHRLVRISPFDANARRHTSFASLDVAPMLEDLDDDIEIDMKDVRVDTYHSSGAGGQNVNKTSSAVRMTHFPSGIVVACQTERDQVQNRATCLKMLKARLLEIREREREQQMADIKGEMKKIEWGSQIRSYVFQPYTMVKDHRTGYETGAIDDVMNGNLDGFTVAYLKMQ